MQEFTVVCTTCQSRIKVRNPNLIGQIVPCPKCSSMVLIENNSRVVVTPTGASANSQTETKVGLGPLSSPSAATDEQSGTQVHKRFKSETPISDLEKSTVDSNAKSSPTTVATNLEQNPVDETSGIVNLAAADWSTTRSRGRRQILLVFFLSLSSCLIAAILFILFIRSWGPPNQIAQGGNDSKTSVQPSLPTETDKDASSPITSEVESNPDNRLPTTENASSLDPNSSTGTESPSDVTSTELTDKPNSLVPSNPPSEDTTPPVEPREPEIQEPDSSTPPVTEPAANDSTGDSPPEMGEESKPPTANSENTLKSVNAPQLPDSLLKLATVFDPSLETRLGETPGSQIKPGNRSPDIAALPITTNSKLHPSPEKPLDYAQSINEEIAGVDIKDRPLVDVLGIWSQLSGIGIDVQWSELAPANVQPQDLISFRSGRISFGDMLRGIAEPLGLQVVESEASWVRLTPTEQRISEMLPKDWSVADLITALCPEDKLTNLLLDLVPTSKGSWTLANGTIQWGQGENQSFQKFSILQVLEHLRVVRGLQLKSKYHVELFNSPWPSPHSESAMKTVLTQPSLKNVPTSQVLANAARESESLLSIDWPGTWDHGLAPSTEDTLLPKGRNLETLAQLVANKHGLEVAWLSSNHLLLATAERLNHMEILVHLSDDDNSDPETLRRRLARVSTLNDQNLPSIRFARDPESGMVLAYIRPPLTSEVLVKP